VPATVEAEGCVVNANFDADPAVTENELDVALVRLPDVADNVRPVPTIVGLNPLNVATPFTALIVDVPDNVPALTLNEIESVDVVTVLPNASCTVTTG
jgi:hypothetical protein